MTLREAQVLFAAEFVTLAVTAAALAIVLLRPAVRRTAPAADGWPTGPRSLLALTGVSLVALGAVSFLHGGNLVSGQSVKWLGLGRLCAAAVLLGAVGAGPGRRTRRLTGILPALGATVWLVAGAEQLAGGARYPIDALLVMGSLLTAASVLGAAQRSVAVRVAASAAASLLLVVVVVALALSTVISSSVQRQELNRLAARGQVEQAALGDFRPVALPARLAESDLAEYTQQQSNPLYNFAYGTPADATTAAATIAARLGQLVSGSDVGNLVYANPDGTQRVHPGLAAAVAYPGGFAAQGSLEPSSCSTGAQGLFADGGGVVLAASSPVCVSSGLRLGAVVSSEPLDGRYLAQRRAIDTSVDLALVAGEQVIATAGMTDSLARSVASSLASASASGRLVAEVRGDRYVSVTSLPVSGRPQRLTVVLSSAATDALNTREQLFRTLFLIAFGGTVVALGLAVFTGDRITAGLRRLTGVAAGIQAGDPAVRAGVGGDDEVAALGSAFDSMLDSVAAQAAALQAAADDEARLRNRLEAVVAGMTDGLVAVDPYGRITDFNRAAVDMSGVVAAEALGSRVERVMRLRTDEGAPAGRAFYLQARREAMVGQLLGATGEIPVAVSAGALGGPGGESAGTVLVFRDLRREHEVEQMKTEFLSRVGHELRTPLTGILGYADILLRRDVPPERARAWHDEILQSARRLLRIVEMLEFFASEGAGRIVLRPEPLDLKALVSGITSSWSDRLPPNVSLGRRVTGDEVMVAADRRWLSLAVDELVDNAVKFSPEGGRILVRVSGSDHRVEIEVTDQGMGMTPEQHDVIFKDFVQGDTSDTRRFGGLGLGLAVVRRVVDGHSGTITCRSVPGRGTTFTVSLPAWPGPAGVVEAPAEPGPPPEGASPKGRRRNGKRPLRSPTRPRSGS